MRDVIISGYVQKDIKRDSKVTKFQISNFKGKVNGKNEYQYITIKVISPDFLVDDGDQIIVKGELDIFKYNDKYYTQIVAFKDNIGTISKSEDSNGQVKQHDEIPF